jgi:hypothetical protein
MWRGLASGLERRCCRAPVARQESNLRSEEQSLLQYWTAKASRYVILRLSRTRSGPVQCSRRVGFSDHSVRRQGGPGAPKVRRARDPFPSERAPAAVARHSPSVSCLLARNSRGSAVGRSGRPVPSVQKRIFLQLKRLQSEKPAGIRRFRANHVNT